MEENGSYKRTPSNAPDIDTDRFFSNASPGAGRWDSVPTDPVAAIQHIANGLKAEQNARHNYREALSVMLNQHESRMDTLEKGLHKTEVQNDSILANQGKLDGMVSQMHTALIGNEMGTTGLVKRVASVETSVQDLNKKAFAQGQVKEAGKTWVDTITKLWPIIIALSAAAAAAGVVLK